MLADLVVDAIRPRLVESGLAGGSRLRAARGGADRDRHRLHHAGLSPPARRSRRQDRGRRRRLRAELAQRRDRCSRPRIAGSSRSAAISAIMRPTTIRCSRPMRARFRPRTFTTSSPRAEPLSDFVRYRYPANLRRRYERVARFPKNYLVFGDARVQLQSGLRPGHDGCGAGGEPARRLPARGRCRSGAALLQRGKGRDRYALGYRGRQRSAASAGRGPAAWRK